MNFEDHSIDATISKVNDLQYKGSIVIRSTVPIGYTSRLQKKYPSLSISFFPEFLREGKALEDSLNPSRIICGGFSKDGKKFLEILSKSSSIENVNTLIVTTEEAEAIKLFSNAYLAMRIAFFNELDTFALSKSFKSKNIIKGMAFDERIGNHYNNPSFGYGGYCLPKDIKQLRSNFGNIKHSIIDAVIDSNKDRKKFIANNIKKYKCENIGVYRLSMKKDSDNYRESAILEILEEIQKSFRNIYIYEPNLDTDSFMEMRVINNIQEFIDKSDLIIANRLEPEIEETNKLIYSRDLFQIN